MVGTQLRTGNLLRQAALLLVNKLCIMVFGYSKGYRIVSVKNTYIFKISKNNSLSPAWLETLQKKEKIVPK